MVNSFSLYLTRITEYTERNEETSKDAVNINTCSHRNSVGSSSYSCPHCGRNARRGRSSTSASEDRDAAARRYTNLSTEPTKYQSRRGANTYWRRHTPCSAYVPCHRVWYRPTYACADTRFDPGWANGSSERCKARKREFSWSG